MRSYASELTQRGGERLHVKRLEEAGTETLGTQFGVDTLVVSRHGNRLHTLAVDASEHLPTAHLRHLNISEHQLRTQTAYHLYRLVGTRCDVYVEVDILHASHHLAQQLQLQAVVIDYDNLYSA